MNAPSNNTAATFNASLLHQGNATPTSVACRTFFPDSECPPHDPLGTEEQFVTILIIALACAVCALYLLVMVMVVLVHKLSALWVKTLVRPTTASTELNDDPRKGLLQETKSSLRSSTNDKAEGKKKKTSFAEDTSCAAPRDVDEEDL